MTYGVANTHMAHRELGWGCRKGKQQQAIFLLILDVASLSTVAT